MRQYGQLAKQADEDLSARTKLRNFRALSARGYLLQLEEAGLEGFQEEPSDPYRVGLDEYSDEYSPEELANLWVSDTPTGLIDGQPANLRDDVEYFN